MFLGLDISTSITGFTLLSDSGDVVLCDYINLKKLSNLFDKAKTVENTLQELFEKYEIKNVWV